ncbi:major facilitator superfamily domain-containing protein [Xylaria sp. FL1042]|nr:major facilitator superfamily domain-containing protein [Xylaria sp. FL1042]
MSLDTPDTWRSLPHKDQLAVLALCSSIDFFQIVSFQTICYYQLKSFNPSATEEVLSWQTGVALASFTASQACTAIPWGYVADAKWGGRRNVLLIGLIGTSLSCLGVAFSTSFASVVIFRALGGAMNGTVGVVHQSRAFLLLPASFSVAALIGPVFAGWLSNPVATYPVPFGHIQWLKRYTYSLPSLLSALLLILTSVAVLFILQETLENYDPWLKLESLERVWYWLMRSTKVVDRKWYFPLFSREHDEPISKSVRLGGRASPQLPCLKTKMSFSEIWTSNVVLTMISLAFFEFHLGAFGSAWHLLLSSSREPSVAVDDLNQKLKGGLGLSPQSLGYTMAFAGFAGLLLQFLFYPAVHKKWGTLKCYRLFSILFPVVYVSSPFLVVMAGSSARLTEAFTWIFLLILLFIHSTSRIFCVPASIMLLNNCSPHPSMLGLVHGIGQAIAAGFRTLGPVCAGYLHGVAIVNRAMGLSWWVVSGTALLAWLFSLLIREGSGQEIVPLCEDNLYKSEPKVSGSKKV